MSLRLHPAPVAGDATPARTSLRTVSRLHGAAWRERVEVWANSPDPRRQAQAHAEILTADVLRFAGWSLDLHPAGVLVAQDGARTLGLLVLPFRFGGDPSAAVRALVRDAVAASDLPWSCLAHVRRAGNAPPEGDAPEALAAALRGWIAAPEQVCWRATIPGTEGNPGTALVVELFRVAMSGPPRLVGVQGPSWAHRAREVVEPRLVEACVRRQRAARVLGDGAFLLACVSDRAWPLTGGWWRECLYGRPTEVASGDTGLRWSYARTSEPAIFRDASLRAPAGVLCIGGDATGAATVTAHAHPWDDATLGPRLLRVPGHDRVDDPQGGDTGTLRWYEEGRGSLES